MRLEKGDVVRHFKREMLTDKQRESSTKYPHIDQSFRFENVSRIREIIIRRILYK